MAATARDRLARTLRGEAQSAFSVELTARMDDLNLEVEGFGHVKFPVTPAKARQLLGLGQPARFGRGEETVTDPEVRGDSSLAASASTPPVRPDSPWCAKARPLVAPGSGTTGSRWHPIGGAPRRRPSVR